MKSIQTGTFVFYHYNCLIFITHSSHNFYYLQFLWRCFPLNNTLWSIRTKFAHSSTLLHYSNNGKTPDLCGVLIPLPLTQMRTRAHTPSGAKTVVIGWPVLLQDRGLVPWPSPSELGLSERESESKWVSGRAIALGLWSRTTGKIGTIRPKDYYWRPYARLLHTTLSLMAHGFSPTRTRRNMYSLEAVTLSCFLVYTFILQQLTQKYSIFL